MHALRGTGTNIGDVTCETAWSATDGEAVGPQVHWGYKVTVVHIIFFSLEWNQTTVYLTEKV